MHPDRNSKPIRSKLMTQLALPFGTATTMIYSNELTGDRVELRTPVPMQPVNHEAQRRALRNNPTKRASVKHHTPKRPTGKKSKPKPVMPAMDKKAKTKPVRK